VQGLGGDDFAARDFFELLISALNAVAAPAASALHLTFAATLSPVAEDGTVNVKFATNPVTTQVLGRLKLVNPPPRTLLRDRDGLFVTLDKSVDQLTADPAIKIRGKFLESSNVSTANAMLQIITQSRAFDMNMKMVQTVSENDKVANSLIGRAR
jgi:flagellar basal-body rod protein FlgF